MSRSLIYTCDDCNSQLDTAVVDLDAARTIAVADGWQTGATDYCDHCRCDDDFTPTPRRSSWLAGDWG